MRTRPEKRKEQHQQQVQQSRAQRDSLQQDDRTPQVVHVQCKAWFSIADVHTYCNKS